MKLDIEYKNSVVKIIITNVDNTINTSSSTQVGAYKVKVEDELICIDHLNEDFIFKPIYSKLIPVGETEVVYLRGDKTYESKKEFNKAIGKELAAMIICILLTIPFSLFIADYAYKSITGKQEATAPVEPVIDKNL